MNTDSIHNDDKLYWYKDAIIYELHIKAFKDSNGDGIGDFAGLLEKLDYLQGLGVTAIWLLPFYPSPQRDDGYDIADYYTINPAYGNIEQFKVVLEEAHKRNLKVITELVINHTSDQHPWFQRARTAPKGSAERDYYVWTDNPNDYKDVRIIFQDFETSNWTWDPIAEQYYWHRFFHHQPDLNYDNPDVQNEVFKIIDYWCDMGVDGFRLDAVPYLFEREGTNGENLPETHAYLKKLRAHVDKHYPGTVLLAEANMWPEDAVSYFGDGDECHMNYHFPLMPRMFMALRMEDKYPITDIFDQTPDIPDNCQWAIFLRNHDELTLEMVTDEERDYMYKVYTADPKAKINLGIRHRLAPLMQNNRKKIELLNYLLFSLPGTPVIYYGDEIGMGDNFYLGDRNGVRTPMQWSIGRNAEFSDANPQQLYLPLIIDPEYHYEAVNVERQEANNSSLLWWMKRLINMRTKYKALSRGKMHYVEADNSKIFAFIRKHENETILVVANLSRYMQHTELNLSNYTDYTPTDILSSNALPAIVQGKPYSVMIGPYDCIWLSLNAHTELQEHTLKLVTVRSAEDINSPYVLEQLGNNVLPAYLNKTRWFGGKGRSIDRVTVKNCIHIPLSSKNAYIMLVEVEYHSGLPEMYQLPVVTGQGSDIKEISDKFPQSIICKIDMNGTEAVLYDALYDEEYLEALLQNMVSQPKQNRDSNHLVYKHSEQLLEWDSNTKIQARVLGVEQSNTSVVYNNKYFLKLYRKVEPAINPDVEISEFLKSTDFQNTPAYVGHIEWQSGNKTMVLGMMQEAILNATDAWDFILDKLDGLHEKALTLLNEEDELPLALGSITQPIDYGKIPSILQEVIDPAFAEQIKLLGTRTGELHLALASNIKKDNFKPEEYSLHYQRSLYSSFQTLVRSNFSNQRSNLENLPEDVYAMANEVLNMKDSILKTFKRIYQKKIDVLKTRIHGDYHLGQVLFDGKDFIILDFEGEPSRSYGERLLKRSPLRDVAGMIRSFHYAIYESLRRNKKITITDQEKLLPVLKQWYHYISGFFMLGYIESVDAAQFIPENEDDFKILLETFLLEKAIYELGYELNNRPDWVRIPLEGIKSIMNNKTAG